MLLHSLIRCSKNSLVTGISIIPLADGAVLFGEPRPGVYPARARQIAANIAKLPELVR